MNRGPRLSTQALAAVLLAGASSFPLPAEGAESEATREIKSRYAGNVQRIRSLDVSYQLETRSNLSPEKLLALPEYMNQMFLPKDEWRVAFKGRKRYTRQLQPERRELLRRPDENGLIVPAQPAADAPPLIRENQKKLRESYDRAVANMKANRARGFAFAVGDPSVVSAGERDQVRAFNGKAIWHRRLDRYEVWPGTSRPNWFQMSEYLASVGLHVPDPRGEDEIVKSQSIFQLASRIKDASYELEPAAEVVDGSTCVVLKGSLGGTAPAVFITSPPTDRLWLDRDHGLLLRKREIAVDGKVSHRWVNTELKEVEPGLWLPQRTRHEQFPHKLVEELGGKPVMTVETRVQKLEVNRVSDGLFDMAPRKGDVIEDMRGGLSGVGPATPNPR
jgi:hypothetical protein